MCVCVCVCVRMRVCVCVCVCMCALTHKCIVKFRSALLVIVLHIICLFLVGGYFLFFSLKTHGNDTGLEYVWTFHESYRATEISDCPDDCYNSGGKSFRLDAVRS